MNKGLAHKAVSVLSLAVLANAPCFSPVRATDEVSPPSVSEQAGATSDRQTECRDLMAGIDEHNRKLGQELRQIKREIAALNQNLEKPGLREIFGGVGYILGLFGIAAFVTARRRDRQTGEN